MCRAPLPGATRFSVGVAPGSGVFRLRAWIEKEQNEWTDESACPSPCEAGIEA